MDRRQALSVAVVTVGLGILGVSVFSPQTDEEQIEVTLRRLSQALSFEEPISNPVFFGSHLSEEFRELMTDQVQIRVSEVSIRLPSHRGQLGLAAAQALSRYGSLNVEFSSFQIEVKGDQASVQVLATLMGDRGDGVRRAERAVRFEMTKTDGDWLVDKAAVEAESAEE